MTAPRMTPTNDAPVTVEAVARIRAYIDAYEDAPNWGGPTMHPAPPAVKDLRTILADLASAPAVDESRAFALVRRIAAREPWQAHYGRTWEDEAADIVAGLPSSAPAGDGVSERDWIMRAFYAEIDRQCSIGAGMAQTCADSGLFQINADIDMHSLAEALARPRAAVGERRNG
jgi:hypothetical protein